MKMRISQIWQVDNDEDLMKLDLSLMNFKAY